MLINMRDGLKKNQNHIVWTPRDEKSNWMAAILLEDRGA